MRQITRKNRRLNCSPETENILRKDRRVFVLLCRMKKQVMVKCFYEILNGKSMRKGSTELSETAGDGSVF